MHKSAVVFNVPVELDRLVTRLIPPTVHTAEGMREPTELRLTLLTDDKGKVTGVYCFGWLMLNEWVGEGEISPYEQAPNVQTANGQASGGCVNGVCSGTVTAIGSKYTTDTANVSPVNNSS